MARAQGARAQMALAFETTYGTPPASSFTRMPFASTSLGAEQPLLNSELLGYGRDPLAPIKDAVTSDGDVVVPIDAQAFGFWLKAAFGQPATTGTGPWTHEFQSGSWTLPSMSIETGMPEVPRYAMYSGCVLDQISWQMQRSGLLTATVSLVAQGESTATASAAGTLVGADFSVSLRAVTQDVASYSSSLAADGGSGRPEQELGGGPETRLILPDIPLLRDIDDTGGASSRIYIALGGYGQANWPGAAAYRSDDNITWDVAEKSGTEIAWGAAISVLPETDAPFATDEETELEVYMTTGAEQLESVTQEVLLNGANAALVLKANGEAEIIQFREVTPNVTGSHTLTGLLRGRRGTDVFTGGHAIGETFVLLQRKAIEGSTLALSELDAVTYWRAVGKGQLFDDVQTVTRTHTGRDLKPYAVAGAAASLSGSDIALSWVRRTRIGGDLRDGTGTVPLSEAHEAYEVDILDGPDGTVLRTLTASGPAVTYAGADIAADLGSTPTELSVVIYQMSDVVGRGFPRAITLEIA